MNNYEFTINVLRVLGIILSGTILFLVIMNITRKISRKISDAINFRTKINRFFDTTESELDIAWNSIITLFAKAPGISASSSYSELIAEAENRNQGRLSAKKTISSESCRLEITGEFSSLKKLNLFFGIILFMENLDEICLDEVLKRYI